MSNYSELNEYLVEIKKEKDNKLLPENIKKGIKILGIEGSYEPPKPNLQDKSVEITENGTTTVVSDEEYDGLNSVEITTNVQGGEVVEEEKVVFYDYDGTVLYEYTVDEIQAMTELPPLPTREGLTCQGWNWTLEGLKTQNSAMDVGAIYITDDGKTRLHIRILEGQTKKIDLHLYPSGSSTTVIDWGDGSPIFTGLTRGGDRTATHTYENSGDYIIKISTLNNETVRLYATSSQNIFGSATSSPIARYSMLKKVFVGENVNVDNYAFNRCSLLEEITIPNGATIGNEFISNTPVKHFNIPKTITTSPIIRENRIIGNITFPEGLTILKSLSNCANIKKVNLPYTLTQIPDSNTFNRLGIEKITIPDNVTTLGKYCFSECYKLKNIKLPDNISTIPEYCFNNCYALEEINIPNNVTNIDNYAFYYCYNLKEINLSDNITRLGNYCFYNCRKIKEIIMPDSITSVGSYCFYYCTCLENVKLSNLLTSLSSYIFAECYNLQNVELHEGITTIYGNAFTSCKNIKSLNFPSSLTTISGSIAGGTPIEELTFGDNFVDLGSTTFDGMENLAIINLPLDYPKTTLPSMYICYSLINFTFPRNITSFPNMANCYALEKIDLTNCDRVIPLSSYQPIRYVSSACKFYVPQSLYEEYKVSGYWTTLDGQGRLIPV